MLNGQSNCLLSVGKHPIRTGNERCADVGGRLPLPLNQKHNQELRAAFNSMGATAQVALGLNYFDGKWRDVDSNAVEYFSWLPNSDLANADYKQFALMWPQTKWLNEQQNYQTKIICQKVCISDNS